jgi:transcriptional regulator with XRE-family HTH domain
MFHGRKPNLERRLFMVELRAKGWTYEAIGNRLGISRQAVHYALTAPPWKSVERDRPGLGRRLKALRMAAGISRRKLARQATVAYGTLRRAETGRSWPHQTTFERLAKAFGVNVADLTGEEPIALPPKSKAKRGERP